MPAPGGPDIPHLWIYVTERDAHTHLAVIVCVSTLREGKDQTTFLRKDDHRFIRHDSVIAYRYSKIIDCREIDAQIQAKTVEAREPCSGKILKEVQQGVTASEFTPKKVIQFCKAAWAAAAPAQSGLPSQRIV